MKGTYTAVITPFKDGKVDYKSLEKIIQYQVENGSSGIVPCGTTGESPTLDHEEHREVIRFTIEKIKEWNQKMNYSLKVIAGAGSNSTEEAISLAKDSESLGADAVMIVSPYYNKPTQDGIFQHYRRIAESIGIEVMVYNIPGRTGILIEIDTMVKICSISNITTIKEATGNIDYTGEILSRLPEVDVLSGNDSMNLPIYSLGGVGSVSVIGNLFPKEVRQIYDFYQAGEVNEAKKLHLKLWPINEVLFLEANPIPIKKACFMEGMIYSDEIRLPLVKATDDLTLKLKQVISTFKSS